MFRKNKVVCVALSSYFFVLCLNSVNFVVEDGNWKYVCARWQKVLLKEEVWCLERRETANTCNKSHWITISCINLMVKMTFPIRPQSWERHPEFNAGPSGPDMLGPCKWNNWKIDSIMFPMFQKGSRSGRGSAGTIPPPGAACLSPGRHTTLVSSLFLFPANRIEMN